MDSPAEKARLFCFVSEINFGNKLQSRIIQAKICV